MEYKQTHILDSWQFISPDSGNSFFYIGTDKNISKYSNNQISKTKLEINCNYVIPWNEGFLINENVYFDKREVRKMSALNNIFFSLIISSQYIIVKDIDFVSEKVKLGLYDNHELNISWYNDEYSYGNPWLTLTNSSFLSFLTKDEIACFDIHGKKKWQVGFQDLVEAKDVIFLNPILGTEGKLFFILINQNKKGLFVLDTESGKQIGFYPNIDGYLAKDLEHIYSVKYPNILCVVDVKSGECQEWDVDKLIKENGFESIADHRFVAEDGIIYFTQSMGAENAKAGVLDTLKRELVWKHDFKQENAGIKTISVQDGNIYINMGDDTLYFFEKNG